MTNSACRLPFVSAGDLRGEIPRTEKGFTLIDMLFVCALIGLLSIIALPRLLLAKRLRERSVRAGPSIYNRLHMWTKMMGGPRKKAPKTIAVIDPDACFGAFACSICQAACPVAGCIVEEPDVNGRMVCAVRADLCIGCGLCVTLGNPTAPQQREFGCPADYDAINMMPFEEVVKLLTANEPVPATT
jgi:H+/Na+-translocating ferredoxin:NAD+ oxidoreductase subunit B